uniref:Uncharacterized protein n=1 Tax=Oryza punctata TaxID=4537 RepID=A0A0E0JG66_ORYPU
MAVAARDGGGASWWRTTARARRSEEGQREAYWVYWVVGVRWRGWIGASGALISWEDPRKHLDRSIVQNSPPPCLFYGSMVQTGNEVL